MVSFENYDSELESIDMELARLAQLCGIDLRRPGVAEQVLKGDASLCTTSNPIAWEKLRGLLVLHYHVVQEEASEEGNAAAADSVRRAVERVTARMKSGRQ